LLCFFFFFVLQLSWIFQNVDSTDVLLKVRAVEVIELAFQKGKCHLLLPPSTATTSSSQPFLTALLEQISSAQSRLRSDALFLLEISSKFLFLDSFGADWLADFAQSLELSLHALLESSDAAAVQKLPLFQHTNKKDFAKRGFRDSFLINGMGTLVALQANGFVRDPARILHLALLFLERGGDALSFKSKALVLNVLERIPAASWWSRSEATAQQRFFPRWVEWVRGGNAKAKWERVLERLAASSNGADLAGLLAEGGKDGESARALLALIEWLGMSPDWEDRHSAIVIIAVLCRVPALRTFVAEHQLLGVLLKKLSDPSPAIGALTIDTISQALLAFPDPAAVVSATFNLFQLQRSSEDEEVCEPLFLLWERCLETFHSEPPSVRSFLDSFLAERSPALQTFVRHLFFESADDHFPLKRAVLKFLQALFHRFPELFWASFAELFLQILEQIASEHVNSLRRWLVDFSAQVDKLAGEPPSVTIDRNRSTAFVQRLHALSDRLKDEVANGEDALDDDLFPPKDDSNEYFVDCE
jgi:hypothetical protein